MIRQRKFFTSTEFEFTPSKLLYTYRNFTGSKQLTVDYSEISLTSKRIEERYPSFLYFGVVVLAVGLILGAQIYSSEDTLYGFTFALWGILFLACYFLQRNVFHVFYVGQDSLLILGGKNEDQILAQITTHRKARFLELLQRPDFVMDEVKRQGLVSWLLENKIFSEDEIPEPQLNERSPNSIQSVH